VDNRIHPPDCHVIPIQVGVSCVLIIRAAGSLGRWISLGFGCVEPGLIGRGIGVLRDIWLGLLDWRRTLVGIIGMRSASSSEQILFDIPIHSCECNSAAQIIAEIGNGPLGFSDFVAVLSGGQWAMGI
jgi:hypothetical protein